MVSWKTKMNNVLFWMSAIVGAISFSVIAHTNEASTTEIVDGMAIAFTYTIWLFWVTAENEAYKNKVG